MVWLSVGGDGAGVCSYCSVWNGNALSMAKVSGKKVNM